MIQLEITCGLRPLIDSCHTFPGARRINGRGLEVGFQAWDVQR